MRAIAWIAVLALALYLGWLFYASSGASSTDVSSGSLDSGTSSSGFSTVGVDMAQLGTQNSGGSMIDLLAQAIFNVEGSSASALNHRNNNPGNLRPPNGSSSFWSGQVGTDSHGFAIFTSIEDGWNALITNLSTHVRKNPDQTLAQYIAQYAPSSDGNNPAAYASTVAGKLGVDPNSTLGQIFGG